MPAPPLTHTQEQAILIVPRLTAALSVLGSGSILLSVLWSMYLRNRNKGSSSGSSSSSSSDVMLGQSLLLGMSLADLLSSFTYVLGATMFPADNKGGRGNQATCNFQGFLCNLQVAAALYSGFLAWYYCLYIRYHWHPRRIRQCFVPCAHLVSWGFVIATVITALVKNLYHPHWIRCYITGPETNFYFWFFFFVPIWTSMLCGSVAMLLIYLYVYNTEVRSVQHTFHYQSRSFTTGILVAPDPESATAAEPTWNASLQSLDAVSHNNNPSNSAQRPKLSELPKTRRVAFQAICYTVAFLICYAFPTTSRTLATINGPTNIPYPIRILATSFVGCQGLLNCLVFFVQPRLHNYLWKRQQQQQQQQQSQSQFMSFSRINRLWSSNNTEQQEHSGPTPPPVEEQDLAVNEQEEDA